MRSTIVRKTALGLVALCAIAGLMVFSGCDDPEKIGGGGQLQPYNGSNGQYK